jgi:hypothetical protein
MARCDQGYLCRVCGEEVEHITDSELYLRYVIGEMDPELLHLSPECHLACAPAFAQFISDARFKCVTATGPFAVSELDPNFVESRRQLLDRGYARLWEIRTERKTPLAVRDYLLPEFHERWK